MASPDAACHHYPHFICKSVIPIFHFHTIIAASHNPPLPPQKSSYLNALCRPSIMLPFPAAHHLHFPLPPFMLPLSSPSSPVLPSVSLSPPPYNTVQLILSPAPELNTLLPSTHRHELHVSAAPPTHSVMQCPHNLLQLHTTIPLQQHAPF